MKLAVTVFLVLFVVGLLADELDSVLPLALFLIYMILGSKAEKKRRQTPTADDGNQRQTPPFSVERRNDDALDFEIPPIQGAPSEPPTVGDDVSPAKNIEEYLEKLEHDLNIFMPRQTETTDGPRQTQTPPPAKTPAPKTPAPRKILPLPGQNPLTAAVVWAEILGKPKALRRR